MSGAPELGAKETIQDTPPASKAWHLKGKVRSLKKKGSLGTLAKELLARGQMIAKKSRHEAQGTSERSMTMYYAKKVLC